MLSCDTASPALPGGSRSTNRRSAAETQGSLRRPLETAPLSVRHQCGRTRTDNAQPRRRPTTSGRGLFLNAIIAAPISWSCLRPKASRSLPNQSAFLIHTVRHVLDEHRRFGHETLIVGEHGREFHAERVHGRDPAGPTSRRPSPVADRPGQPPISKGMVSAISTVKPHSAGAEPRIVSRCAATRSASISLRVDHHGLVRSSSR